jgi:hypothetical protein
MFLCFSRATLLADFAMSRVAMLNHNRRPHNTDAPDVVADIRGHVCTAGLKGFRQKPRHRAERKGACLGHALVCAANLVFYQDSIRTNVEIELRHDGPSASWNASRKADLKRRLLNVWGRVTRSRRLVSPPSGPIRAQELGFAAHDQFFRSKTHSRDVYEGAMTGAQFEIRIDGTPRSYRDRKDYALEAARAHQKQESAQHGQGQRLANGDVTAVALRPG